MALELSSLGDLRALGFDEIIDVRSPSEFAEDHVPGAVNLPVLDDEERAKVGTIYVQDSRFKARRLGAALVAQNAARHIAGHLADKGPAYRPLVYCWRGGQRSGSFATILAQIGWRVELLSGGYRSYRRLVQHTLYDGQFPAPVIILDGNTGTAKTALLARLAAKGVQVIDLEGLANHRGSLFGSCAGGQPTQKAFESALADQVIALDPARPVLVEAESSKIGERIVPPSLWRAMNEAPRIEITAPLEARAKYLARAYSDMTADTSEFSATIDQMRPYHSAEVIERWLALFASGAYEALAAQLMAEHYDPRYAKSRARRPDAVASLTAADLSDDALDVLALDIAAEVGRASTPQRSTETPA